MPEQQDSEELRLAKSLARSAVEVRMSLVRGYGINSITAPLIRDIEGLLNWVYKLGFQEGQKHDDKGSGSDKSV